jgi:serine/threonine protein kinase
MMGDPVRTNWNAIAPSAFPWEKEALDFIRSQFPAHEPYRAWSNFEFIADDGSLNEVDLLVFTPQGFYLVEIKSTPGVLSGDTHTWVWEENGRQKVVDNPLFLANQKAKKLASLLQRQRAFQKLRVPFIEPLIFCSAADLQCQLQANARFHVCLRDQTDRPGIMAAIRRRHCPGLSERPRGTFDRPMAKAISRALEQLGIKPSQRSRRVGDYELQAMLDEGPGYQDFLGKHVAIPGTFRRIRVYLVQAEAGREQRMTLQRAAEREFRLLQLLEHRGVLRAMDFTVHELGPTIIFQHFPQAVRLDHYLIEYKARISDEVRLGLMRQLAETIRFAHEKHVVHRALSPRAILVVDPQSPNPRTVIMNWQLGYRQASTEGSGASAKVTPTIHVNRLAEEVSWLYMAPETLVDLEALGEHQDIFSLGAICYQLFTGQAPAESPTALTEKLRTHRGLRVSAVLNGAPEALEQLVAYSTDPDVSNRLDTAEEFISYLNRLEDELTTPSNQLVGDPAQAKADDFLPGGYEVVRKLGMGSTAAAFLVKKDGREYVVKVAVDADHNDRVRDEGEVLQKLDSALIVRCHQILQMNDRTAILLNRAGETTLGQRIRLEGRLSLEMLQRFGEDLLTAVALLERKGIAHRDIKPENIGVSAVGRGDPLHLVLFDFSLSRCSPDNVRAGTPGYLDPFLSLRKPPRWDLQAERFAAAVTLYKMATGILPVWHDGKTDPAMVECEATIDAEQFDPELRDKLTGFFRQALRRDPRGRFDNAQQMLEAWRAVFSVPSPIVPAEEGVEPDNASLLVAATADTSVAELGLGRAAVDALDRVNVVKVSDLLQLGARRLFHMRGVGHKTRKRILAAVKVLRERLESAAAGVAPATITDDTYEGAVPKERLSIDMLASRVLGAKAKSRSATENTALEALLGLDQRLEQIWPSQGDVAPLAGVTRGRISQILTDAQGRWIRDPALTAVRNELAELLAGHGGVMAAEEVCQVLLVSRGSVEEEPKRSRLARVVTRAAVETETARDEPRFIVRRAGANALIAADLSLADYAAALGQKADQLANEDPLVPPARAIEILREVSLPPEGEPLTDVRLTRLAVAASQCAAVSSRQEFYRRGMDAGRAIKLSHGGLVGVRFLTPDQIRQRVGSRYPLAAPLPGRPQLDTLLRQAGLELDWDPDRPGGGAYKSTAQSVLSVSETSGTPPRYPTVVSPPGAAVTGRPVVSPEEAEARVFEERLRYAERNGAFLALTVKANVYRHAFSELTARFETRPLDLERVFLDALRKASDEVGANWDVVVKADAAPPDSTDWRNLNQLIASRVIPKIEEACIQGDRTVLAYNLNWLARYGQVEVVLTRVQQAVHDARLHGAWLLIPASPQTEMPLLDGVAVPVITSNQWAHVPESWCQNLHRSGGTSSGRRAVGAAEGDLAYDD